MDEFYMMNGIYYSEMSSNSKIASHNLRFTVSNRPLVASLTESGLLQQR